MKALLQRVSQASVSISGKVVGKISKGLVILVGIANGDNEKDILYLVDKIVNLRIFGDTESKLNLSLLNLKGELLIISQFTLLADTRKGRRPSFINAAPPDQAQGLFNKFLIEIGKTGLTVETGIFQEYMKVEIHNDGPVTIMLDSREKFENCYKNSPTTL